MPVARTVAANKAQVAMESVVKKLGMCPPSVSVDTYNLALSSDRCGISHLTIPPNVTDFKG